MKVLKTVAFCCAIGYSNAQAKYEMIDNGYSFSNYNQNLFVS